MAEDHSSILSRVRGNRERLSGGSPHLRSRPDPYRRRQQIWLLLHRIHSLRRDPVKLDPKHYKVELENEQMRVVRIKYRAHEKSPMHQHPRGVVVFLTDAHFKFTYPDGKTEEFRNNPGEFMAFTDFGNTSLRT